jgi:hypothetical protein
MSPDCVEHYFHRFFRDVSGGLPHVNQLSSRLGHIVGQSPYGSERNARTSSPGMQVNALSPAQAFLDHCPQARTNSELDESAL